MEKSMKNKIISMIVACIVVIFVGGCAVTTTVTTTDKDGNTTTVEEVNGVKTTTTTDADGNTTITNDDGSVIYEKLPMLFVNNLGFDVAELYIRMSYNEDWGNNMVIGDNALPSGREYPGMDLTFREGDTIDLFVVNSDGDELEFDEVDLSPAEGKAFALILEYNEENDEYIAYVEKR